MKRVVIFDFDGVILDSWEHAYGRNLRSWPDLQPHEHKSFFNGNIHAEIAKMPPSVISDEDQQRWLEDEWYPKKKKLPMFEGIAEVIKTLTQNYILVINTSESSTSVKEYLAENGISALFDKIYGMETSKDKSEKFNQILKDYNIAPEDCVFVTDTVGDVLEAQQCSIASIVVTYGYQDRKYFDAIQDKVLGFAETPEEIVALID